MLDLRTILTYIFILRHVYFNLRS